MEAEVNFWDYDRHKIRKRTKPVFDTLINEPLFSAASQPTDVIWTHVINDNRRLAILDSSNFEPFISGFVQAVTIHNIPVNVTEKASEIFPFYVKFTSPHSEHTRAKFFVNVLYETIKKLRDKLVFHPIDPTFLPTCIAMFMPVDCPRGLLEDVQVSWPGLNVTVDDALVLFKVLQCVTVTLPYRITANFLDLTSDHTRRFPVLTCQVVTLNRLSTEMLKDAVERNSANAQRVLDNFDPTLRKKFLPRIMHSRKPGASPSTDEVMPRVVLRKRKLQSSFDDIPQPTSMKPPNAVTKDQPAHATIYDPCRDYELEAAIYNPCELGRIMNSTLLYVPERVLTNSVPDSAALTNLVDSILNVDVTGGPAVLNRFVERLLLHVALYHPISNTATTTTESNSTTPSLADSSLSSPKPLCSNPDKTETQTASPLQNNTEEGQREETKIGAVRKLFLDNYEVSPSVADRIQLHDFHELIDAENERRRSYNSQVPNTDFYLPLLPKIYRADLLKMLQKKFPQTFTDELVCMTQPKTPEQKRNVEIPHIRRKTRS